MRIAWLTTSRADFGICIPMIQKLKAIGQIELEIIATGSHLMVDHGNTVSEIRLLEIPVHEVPVELYGHSVVSVAHSYAATAKVFASFWEKNHDFDLLFALGDRYEMAAALLASVPFRIPIAHLCGGDVTDGATDQMYRDIISLIAQFHFTTEAKSAERVAQLKKPYHDQIIAHVGSLAIEQLHQHVNVDATTFIDRWGIDLNMPFYLVTVHPETMRIEDNAHHVSEMELFLKKALNEDTAQWLITLPNADAESEMWRNMFISIANQFPTQVKCHAHLGIQGYYTAMKNCSAMIGNTSSGIVESATMGAWVLNLGDRQKGRSRNANVQDVSFEHTEIFKHWKGISKERYQGKNLYGDGSTSNQILDILKDNFNALHGL